MGFIIQLIGAIASGVAGACTATLGACRVKNLLEERRKQKEQLQENVEDEEESE